MELREQGLVKRIGISIYTESDLQDINTELLNVVQLLHHLDQRLLENGTIARLQQILIHARACLQGLILTSTEKWPWVKTEVKQQQSRFIDFAKKRG